MGLLLHPIALSFLERNLCCEFSLPTCHHMAYWFLHASFASAVRITNSVCAVSEVADCRPVSCTAIVSVVASRCSTLLALHVSQPLNGAVMIWCSFCRETFETFHDNLQVFERLNKSFTFHKKVMCFDFMTEGC
jgi:hypothetical protein